MTKKSILLFLLDFKTMLQTLSDPHCKLLIFNGQPLTNFKILRQLVDQGESDIKDSLVKECKMHVYLTEIKCSTGVLGFQTCKLVHVL